MFILGIQKFTPQLDIVMAELEKSELTDDMALHEIFQSKDSNIYIDGLFVCMGFFISIVGAMAWFPFYIVYTRRYKNKNNSLKRTEKGEQLTDVILGMKRFIHDFSMLDTATKEQIVLWDDFLIYAIVLEENEKIIDEILAVNNIEKIDTYKIVQ